MDPRQMNALSLALIVVLAALAGWLVWPPAETISRGLDIQGGLSVILTAKPEAGKTVTSDQMQRAETIITNRVNGLGVSEASVQLQGDDSILVQLPGVADAEGALAALGETGRLEFVVWESIDATTRAEWDAYLDARRQGAGGDQPKPLERGSYTLVTDNAGQAPLTGEHVKNAVVSTGDSGQIVVNVEMDSEGARIWREYTTSHVFTQVGELASQVAIILDGVVWSNPSIRSAIPDGSTEISGGFTPDEARNLGAILESGALPIELEASESRVVGPTLGEESLKQGLLAGLVGLAAVAVFMVLFYRAFGLLSWASLVLFGLIELGILAALSRGGLFALSLPGVAGIVLSVGIAADSSILIFERFKEEVAMGKTPRSAARSGTRHALGTSITADFVTFISAITIWSLAIGPVKGFAFTLMLGIVCELTVAILFTRAMVEILSETAANRLPWLFGLKGGEADV